MLTLTPTAGKVLKHLIDNAESPDGKSIRMVASDNGFDLTLDEPQPEDTVIEHDEAAVLLLTPDVAERLGDKTIDVVSTEQGAQLVLR